MTALSPSLVFEYRPLGDLASFINGHAFKPTDWEDEGLPIIRIQNLTGTQNKFNRTTKSVAKKFHISDGDLLISWSASLGVYIWMGDKALLNQHIFKAEPHGGVDKEYLYYVVHHVLDLLKAKTHGSTMKHVKRGDFEGTLVPFPPIDEQRRIINILKRADRIRRLRKQAQDTARQLIPALFIDMFGDPQLNPKGWLAKPLGNVVSLRSGGTPSKKKPEYWNGAIPWVSPKDMKPDCILDSIDHITEKALEETTLKWIPAESVLIVVRGMILVHTVPIRVNISKVTINQDMKALEPNKELSANYLRWSLQCMHSHLLSQVSSSAHGTRKLDTNRLLALSIPLPPLRMQKKFESQLSSLESILRQQAAAQAGAESGFQSLLHRAFSGKI